LLRYVQFVADEVCGGRYLIAYDTTRRWHQRSAGSGVSFGPHDVRILSGSPAVSVPPYSPPLTSMDFYDLDPAAGLRRLASLLTEDPEPAPPGLARDTSAA
jgi:hypothetical protein